MFTFLNQLNINGITMKKIILLLVCLLTGCVGIPENIQPVDNFKLEKYLGKWYEIARLDHSFERGLNRVSAEYSLRPDGGIKVINRGYLAKDKKWKDRAIQEVITLLRDDYPTLMSVLGALGEVAV